VHVIIIKHKREEGNDCRHTRGNRHNTSFDY